MKMNSAKLASAVALCLSLVAVITLLGYESSYAQTDSRNFWLLNNTGRTIVVFNVSAHQSRNWGRNILEGVGLPTGLGAFIILTQMSVIPAQWTSDYYSATELSNCTSREETSA